MSAQQDTVFAAPPVAVTTASAFVSLPDLVLWATLAYTVLMASRLVWRWRNEYLDRKAVKYGRRSTDAQLEEE